MKKAIDPFITFTSSYHFRMFFFSTVTQPLGISCPPLQNGQYQCNQQTTTVNFPVATVTGGSGTVSPVTYSATGSTFGTPSNNQVTGTFPTSSPNFRVTASVTDTAGGSVQCMFFVVLTQGNTCNISESRTVC